jgi:hypothetical protein
MKKVLTLILFFWVTNFYAMEEEIEGYVSNIIQQSCNTIQAISNKQGSFEDWVGLMRNAGKLEACLDCNLIQDKDVAKEVAAGLNEIDTAWQTHLKTTKKEKVIEQLEDIKQELEELTLRNNKDA